MHKSKTSQRLDEATGLVWLAAFAERFHIDTSKWTTQQLDDTFLYQGLPDQPVAEKLADYISSKHHVQTHVYEPMGNRWQVVIMRK